MNKVWQTVEAQPGFFGARRNARFEEYNQRFGQGNWRVSWQIGEQIVGFLGACALYEDGYLEFLKSQPTILEQLLAEASEVYDNDPSNLESGLDYNHQESHLTHLQDISLRRCVLRLGRNFQGSQPLQIRGSKGIHPLSQILCPGNVPFHLPHLIRNPELVGWWKPQSIEGFYQSNKIIEALI